MAGKHIINYSIKVKEIVTMLETAVVLTPIHFVYLIGVIVILGLMIMRKDAPLPCLIFLFIIGVLATNSIVGGVQSVFNSVVYAGATFMDIIITIALISALSKCLSDIGSDGILISPMLKIMKTPKKAFWIIGISMSIFALFFWPSPASALIGAIMLPVALATGITPLAAAVAMNLFGHGITLSGDFVIQGAPSVSAAAAGILPTDIMSQGFPLFAVMAVVTVVAGYFFNKKDMNKKEETTNKKMDKKEVTKAAKVTAILTPVTFIISIITILALKLKGGEATALIVGAAIFIMCIGTILNYKKEAFDKITEYINYGFLFGMKVFAPVIIIAAFFFLGGDSITKILGEQFKSGLMNDWALWIAQNAPVNKYIAAAVQLVVGGLTGLDGSGFSGLPLTGSLAATFGGIVGGSIPVFAALGQISAIWVGGGTIIPWGLISVAAICNVDPVELARRNFKPVMIGLGATLIVTWLIL